MQKIKAFNACSCSIDEMRNHHDKVPPRHRIKAAIAGAETAPMLFPNNSRLHRAEAIVTTIRGHVLAGGINAPLERMGLT
jgi:hypothetical protein